MREKRYFKNRMAMALLVLAGFLLTGCQSGERPEEKQGGKQEEQGNCGQNGQESSVSVVTFQMVPSSDGVEDFLRILGRHGEEDSGQCYNVTPEGIAEQYGLAVFKFDKFCDSFLLYDGEVYPLGEWFGGFGVTSFAVADLNEDGKTELYFTYSWGSGIPRSQVGYFDTANQETVLFDFSNMFGEAVLAADDDGTLCVYRADFQVHSFVDIALTAEDKIATLLFDSEKISLVEERQSGQEEEETEKGVL